MVNIPHIKMLITNGFPGWCKQQKVSPCFTHMAWCSSIAIHNHQCCLTITNNHQEPSISSNPYLSPVIANNSTVCSYHQPLATVTTSMCMDIFIIWIPLSSYMSNQQDTSYSFEWSSCFSPHSPSNNHQITIISTWIALQLLVSLGDRCLLDEMSTDLSEFGAQDLANVAWVTWSKGRPVGGHHSK